MHLMRQHKLWFRDHKQFEKQAKFPKFLMSLLNFCMPLLRFYLNKSRNDTITEGRSALSRIHHFRPSSLFDFQSDFSFGQMLKKESRQCFLLAVSTYHFSCQALERAAARFKMAPISVSPASLKANGLLSSLSSTKVTHETKLCYVLLLLSGGNGKLW